MSTRSESSDNPSGGHPGRERSLGLRTLHRGHGKKRALGHQAKGLTQVRGLAADFQVALQSDPQGQRFAHSRVVIDDEDPAAHPVPVLAHGSLLRR
jgi:hypothetical protein